MSQFIDPKWLVWALEKSRGVERIGELYEVLDAYLPHPSPKSRRRAINYILRLLELRGEGEAIRRHPLLRLFSCLNDEKVKRELVYWQVIKNLPYIRDFVLFLNQYIEREELSRQKARDFLYSLMGKQSITTFNALLSLLDKFNLIQRGKGTIFLGYYSPSRLAFSFALCEDMLREGRVTLDLGGLKEATVPRVFFIHKEKLIYYIEEEKNLWQVERRPPLNRILLLIRSLEEVVDYLKGGI